MSQQNFLRRNGNWIAFGVLAAGLIGLSYYVTKELRALEYEDEEEPERPEFPMPHGMFGDIPFIPLGDGPPEVYIVRIVSPWGESMDVEFTPEEWDMVHQVAQISGDPFEQVILDVVAERRKNGNL